MLKWMGAAAGIVLLLVLLPPALFFFVLTPRVRGDLVTTLAAQTGYRVEIDELSSSIWPEVSLSGRGLRVGGSHAGAPPLVALESFAVETSLSSLLASPRRLHLVRVGGLHVHVPRRGDDVKDRRTSVSPSGAAPVVIDRLEAGNARIEIAAKRADKPPRVYDIHQLTLESLALDRPIAFNASLTNPRPTGLVATEGSFGPWNRDEPRETPIAGTYRFTGADLDTFKGIGGVLDSTGTYSGTLDTIAVSGTARIPDFSVDVSGHPVPLETAFDAEVGGTTGDVVLAPVLVRFLDSDLRAEGSVVRSLAEPGRVVDLRVTGVGSRIEDLLRLALEAETPPLTGDVALSTRLLIPPGDARVVEKMTLDGQFSIASATFTGVNVQRTLERLSRAVGVDVSGDSGESVVSDLEGAFTMQDAVLRFSRVTFRIPGMEVRLAGSYGLTDQMLDLSGELAFTQIVGRALSGRLGGLSRFVEPFAGRLSREVTLPISIRGPRAKPSFRADVKGVRLR